MIQLGRATQADYRRLKPGFDLASASCRAAGAGRSVEPGSPAWYQLKSRELGRRFIRQMVTAHGEHVLSSRDLTELLGVSYDQVPALAGS